MRPFAESVPAAKLCMSRTSCPSCLGIIRETTVLTWTVTRYPHSVQWPWPRVPHWQVTAASFANPPTTLGCTVLWHKAPEGSLTDHGLIRTIRRHFSTILPVLWFIRHGMTLESRTSRFFTTFWDISNYVISQCTNEENALSKRSWDHNSTNS